MSHDEPDPSGDTEMFRAFVESEARYEARPSHKGPLIVAGLAVALAAIAFFFVISSR